jgi:hypothetical protein
VTVSNTWVMYRQICGLFFDVGTIYVEPHQSGRSKTQSLGGKMMRPTDVAIA